MLILAMVFLKKIVSNRLELSQEWLFIGLDEMLEDVHLEQK